MSDDLDRAVDARIDAYRPEALPPFSVIEGRKRGRDRRRAAVAGVALSAVAFAGAAFAVPSLVGAGDRLTSGVAGAGPSEGGLATVAPTEQGEAVALDGTSYMVSEAGSALTVSVPVGGGCQTLGTGSVLVDETADAVRLRALVVRPPAPPAPSVPADSTLVCTTELRIQQVTIRLDEPVGGRQVIDEFTGDVLRPLQQQGARHSLYSHCGILSTTFDGALWLADPPLRDDSGNPPPGWDENETVGLFIQTTATEATFKADTGVEARFTKAKVGTSDPAANCE